MPLGIVSQGEYDKVVKANNEMRAKMEKLRLENALLRDQIRAILTLPPELSKLYVYIQLKISATLKEIAANDKFSALGEKEIRKRLDDLVKRRLVQKIEKDSGLHYSVESAEVNTAWVPKKEVKSISQS
jgi:hypothetical protein